MGGRLGGRLVGKSDFNENPVVSLDLDFDLGFVNFSLCQECLEMINESGYVDSGWGCWRLDRDSGKTICINLDFN